MDLSQNLRGRFRCDRPNKSFWRDRTPAKDRGDVADLNRHPAQRRATKPDSEERRRGRVRAKVEPHLRDEWKAAELFVERLEKFRGVDAFEAAEIFLSANPILSKEPAQVAGE